MVDVVALERDLVAFSSEVKSLWLGLVLTMKAVQYRAYPVVVAIAGSGPAGGAVDLAVTDRDSGVGIVAAHDVLAADQ